MKLGMLTAILDDYSYEEAIDAAAALGYECVEVACWPQGKAERRYAGTSHIDAERILTDDAYRDHVKSYVAEKGIELSALGYYPNVLDPDLYRREVFVAHLMALIHAAARLDVPVVTTFIGRDQKLNVEENLELVKQVWPAIIKTAEDEGIKIAIENCPMLFGPEQWPGGQNLCTSPEMWKRIFEILPSENLGINFDPSHFVWQQLDYVRAVREFGDKIFHVHFKDIKLLSDELARVGVLAYPLEYMVPKLPGLGDVDWGSFVSALTEAGYNGPACVEMEDRAFESSRQKVIDSLTLARRYMLQFVI